MELVRLPKSKVFDLMAYRVHSDEVADFHNCPAKYRIPCAPARTSKSFAAAHDAAAEGLPWFAKEGDAKPCPWRSTLTWLIGPDYTTNKEFQYIWEVLFENGLLEKLGAKITKRHNSPQQGNLILVAEWGRSPRHGIVRSVWEGKSAKVEKGLQGEHVDHWIQSEAAEHDKRVWRKYGRTRSVRATFPTTPKVHGEWLYDMIQESEQDPEVAAFTFRPEANPEYPWDNFWIAHRGAEQGLGLRTPTEPFAHTCLLYHGGDVLVNPACRAVEDADFAEQFLGQWTFSQGRVLPFAWRPGMSAWCNVVDADPPWLDGADWLWSFDYGYDHPWVGLLWAIGPDGTLLIVDSFYESKLSDDDVIERVTQLESRYGVRNVAYAGDPKRPEVARMLRKSGKLRIWDRDKNLQADRAAGHRALVNAIKPQADTGQPRLYVHARNQAVIAEWKKLRAKEGDYANEWGTSAIAGADHAFDAARYGIFVAEKMVPKPKRHDWLREHMATWERIRRQAPATARAPRPLRGRGLAVA